MLQEIIVKGKYRCNNCGELYTKEQGYLAKGNNYLCSMKCVLEWDDKAREAAHKEWVERWAPQQQKVIENLKKEKEK